MVIAVPALEVKYMAVPKAACTSVKAALLDLDPDTPETRDDLDEADDVHRVYPTRRFRWDRWTPYEGYFGFAVIRDPLRRLLSVYCDRIRDRGELARSPGIARQTELSADPDPDAFFENLDAYRRLASTVKHHTLPYWLFLGEDFRAYDAIYPVKALPRLEERLSERAGRRVRIPHLNQSETDVAFTDLSRRAQDSLRAALRPDYRLLRDYYEPPF